MISERISDDISPQMKILNIVIPILMHVCSLVSNWKINAKPSLVRYLTGTITSHSGIYPVLKTV